MRSVAGLTLVSRVLGFGRDMVMASLLGASAISDAFLLAWLLPNLMRRLFGEGAFAAALIPVFIDARESGTEDRARGLVSAATTRLALVLLALIVVGEVLLTWGLSYADAPIAGWPKLQRALHSSALAMELARVLLPYLGFICLAGVLGGALNALDRFLVPAAAPVLLNVVWIGALAAGALVYEDALGRVLLLVWALVGAGVLQFALHLGACHRAGLPVRPRWQTDPELLRRVRSLFFSLALGLTVFQLNVLFDSLIAYAFVPAGGVTALYYGNRLIQLPIGVLGVALSTVIFPQLARLAKRGDHAGLGQILDQGIRIGLYVSLPAAVGLAALYGPIVDVLFGHGEFDAGSVRRTGAVLLCLTPAVVAACVTPVLARAFYAEEETRVPVYVSVGCVLVNLTLNLILVTPLGEMGLALSTSTSQCLNLLLLSVFSRRRRVLRLDRPRTLQTFRGLAAFCGLALAMGLGAHLTFRLVPLPETVRLALAVGVGVGIYLGGSRLFRIRELSLLLSRGR
ncbi:MAG: murein biosynthesis integral membrane protein MurJ [Planctomycetota bacterium]